MAEDKTFDWLLTLFVAGAFAAGALELVVHFTGRADLVLPELRLAWAMKLHPGAYFPPRGLARFGLCAAAVALLALASAFIKESRPEPALPAPSPQGPAPEPGPAPDDPKERVLAYCRAHDGRITSSDCAQLLGVSHRQAQRILTDLEKQGLLIREGGASRRHVSYRLADRTFSESHYQLPVLCP